jgi:hypothetical protein
MSNNFLCDYKCLRIEEESVRLRTLFKMAITECLNRHKVNISIKQGTSLIVDIKQVLENLSSVEV